MRAVCTRREHRYRVGSRPYILIFLLLITNAAGQESKSSRGPQSQARQYSSEEARGIISGRVLQAGTGEALRKVVVFARNTESQDNRGRAGDSLSAISDADGLFTIREVPRGTYTLTALRNGYVNQVYGQTGITGSGSRVSVEIGQHIDNIVFRMKPAGVIIGRVVDEDGDPLPNLSVEALEIALTGGDQPEESITVRGMSLTNDVGEFRIFGLPPRSYYLRVGNMGMPAMSGRLAADSLLVYASVFYPGTMEFKQAQAIKVHPGEEMHADFMLFPAHSVHVKGKVMNPTGKPNREISMNLLLRQDLETGMGNMRSGRSNFTRIHDDGTFEFRQVLPGNYIVAAHLVDGNEFLYGRQSITVGGTELDNISVGLQKGAEVKGKVLIDGNVPDKLSTLSVVLGPKTNGMPGGGAYARVSEDGAFTLKSVASDLFSLWVNPMPRDSYLKSLRIGNQETSPRMVNFMEGAHGPIEIVISAHGAAVQGRVLDKEHKPSAAAVVLLVPDKKDERDPVPYRAEVTDQDGHFTIRGVRPGNYTTYAFDTVDVYHDPDFQKKYESEGKSLRVNEDERKSLELGLITSREAE